MTRLKAEWEKQEGILVSFPHKNSDWINKLKRIIPTYIDLINKISIFQKIYVFCKNIEEVKKYFKKDNLNILYYQIDFNDTWIRDYGFLTVDKNSKKQFLNFNFNGWGEKYNYFLDNSFNEKIYKKQIFNKTILMKNIDFILEGGSIDSNGNNIIITTSRCLLNKNRNFNINCYEIEKILNKHLGVEKILWLNNGYILGDDTDGHIDMLARFISRNKIIYTKSYDKNDEHYSELNRMENELNQLNIKNNNFFELIPIPLPSAIYNNNIRLPASYINFLIINGAVLYPKYFVKEDEIVYDIFKKQFINREIIEIDSRYLIEEGGSLHCATMQF